MTTVKDTFAMDAEVDTAIKQLVDTKKSNSLNLTEFVTANIQLIIEHSPKNQDLTTRKKVDWNAIKKEASKKQKTSTSSSTRETKRSSSKTDSCELSEADKKKVTESYEALIDDKKWAFTRENGEIAKVEDIMLRHVKNCEREHAALSLILNTDDPVWIGEEYFSRLEIQQLEEWGGPKMAMPSLSDKCRDLVDTCYSVVTTIIKANEGLDEQLMDKCIVDGVSSWLKTLDLFDEYEEYDEYWLVASLKEFCDMYRWKVPARVGSQSSEIDFIIQIWSQLDKCFRNLCMDTHRDVSCAATLVRVNEGRKFDVFSAIPDQQRAVGPDLVLSKDNMEYGAGECGKADLAGIGKVETQLHTPKVLKDMFLRAAEKVGNSVEFLRSFRIVGFNQTHKRMSITVIDCPSGYVCRMRTSEEYEFPARPSLLCSGVLPILSLTLKAKRIVQESVDLLNSYQNSQGTTEPGFVFTHMAASGTLTIPPCFTMTNRKQKSSVSDTPPTQ